jgi:hypothetical protein
MWYQVLFHENIGGRGGTPPYVLKLGVSFIAWHFVSKKNSIGCLLHKNLVGLQSRSQEGGEILASSLRPSFRV